jgi:hypothetical protein
MAATSFLSRPPVHCELRCFELLLDTNIIGVCIQDGLPLVRRLLIVEASKELLLSGFAMGGALALPHVNFPRAT